MTSPSVNKVNTIKVKIIDENFRDLALDWSTAETECVEKQVFCQLAEITGIPVENTSEFYIWKQVNPQVTVAIPAFNDGRDQRANTSNFTRDRVMNVLKEGDKFYITTYLRCQLNKRLNVGYMLVDENLTEQTKCTRHFCRHSHTRTIIDKERKLITDETLMATLSQHLDIEGDFHQWDIIFRELNISQYLYINCSCTPKIDNPELYWRYRG